MDNAPMWIGTAFALAAGLMWGLVFVGPLLLPEYPATLQSFGRYLAFGLIALPLGWLDRPRLLSLDSGCVWGGELTAVRNKGMWGKSGLLQGRVLSVNANGRTVRLSGAFDDKGVTGTAGISSWSTAPLSSCGR